MMRSWLPRVPLTIGLTAVLACGERLTEPESRSLLENAVTYAEVSSNTWIKRANLSLSRMLPALGAVTNAAGEWNVYAIGGIAPQTQGSTRTVQVYNVVTNTWTVKTQTPFNRYATNGIGVIGGKLYISGGLTGQGSFRKELYRYNPDTDVWVQKRSMPSPGSHGITGVINGQLYVLTTCSEFAQCNPSPALAFYRYNPAADTWTTLPIPSSQHRAGEGGVIANKFYVTGGDDVTQLDVYDPATNTWTTKASMPQDQSFGAGAVLGGKLYVIGGVERDANGDLRLLSTTSVYDPITDNWTTAAPRPDARANIAATRVFVNGQPRIEVVGGGLPRSGSNLQYIR